MVIFYIWGTSRLRAFPAQTLYGPSTGARSWTIGATSLYKGLRPVTSRLGTAVRLPPPAYRRILFRNVLLYTEVDLRRCAFQHSFSHVVLLLATHAVLTPGATVRLILEHPSLST
jgi:hypothetical protein